LWEARHHAWFALKAMFPGQDAFSTDVAVPISRLPESITEAQRLLGEHQLTGTIIGHVGDGNYHALVVADRANPDALARAMQVNEGIVRHAIGLGGTATGEHGVGIRKRKFMALEHGASLGTMQAVKHALDPLGIMNPGKLIDDLETWPECD
jgi:D-lactate dehydrogenase (cytochrome)